MRKKWFKTYLWDPGNGTPVLSRCRRFLNQFETCVNVSPVFLASNFFSSGVGYLFQWNEHECFNRPSSKRKSFKITFYTCFVHSNLLMHFDFSLWNNTQSLRHPKLFSVVDISYECDIYLRHLKIRIIIDSYILTFKSHIFPLNGVTNLNGDLELFLLLCNEPWTRAIEVPNEIWPKNSGTQAIYIDHDINLDDMQLQLGLCYTYNNNKITHSIWMSKFQNTIETTVFVFTVECFHWVELIHFVVNCKGASPTFQYHLFAEVLHINIVFVRLKNRMVFDPNRN